MDKEERMVKATMDILAEELTDIDSYNPTSEQTNFATNELMEEFILIILRKGNLLRSNIVRIHPLDFYQEKATFFCSYSDSAALNWK